MLTLVVLMVSCARQDAEWEPREGDRIQAVEIRYKDMMSGHEPCLSDYLQLKAGSVYTFKALERDMKALYDSGYVEDVSVLAEPADDGIRLLFEVSRKAPPGPLRFIGNTAFSDARLARLIADDQGAGPDPASITLACLQGHAKTIEGFYRKGGFARVRVRVQAFDGGPVTADDFQFMIEEGEAGRQRAEDD